MKIAHVCLSNFYIDGFGYQENDLVREHVAAGHEVLVIASTETIQGGKVTYVAPGTYQGGDGARVVRLPYRKGPHKLMRKLRMHPGVYAALAEFAPDSILFHGTCGWEVRTVARYAHDHPDTLFYVDSHEDQYNSARNFLSREGLHRRFYGPVLRSALPQVRKILCITTETIDFVHDTYDVPRGRLEFFPLGGRPPEDGEYEERRARKRAELGLAEGEIMLVQSGKQTRRKKLIESLTAFAATPAPKLRLFVAGVLDEEIAVEAEALIAADPRVAFLGWQPREALTDLLCAADIYLQPGTQSATMQESLCCRCAVILDDAPSHTVFKHDNGWFVRDQGELAQALSEAARADIGAMQANSEALAREMLDYRVLARRVLQ